MVLPMMAGRRMFCLTVSPSRRRKSWNTNPSSRLRTLAICVSSKRLKSVSPSFTFPESIGIYREMQFKRVVFPEPELPMTAANSPSITVKETPLRTG